MPVTSIIVTLETNAVPLIFNNGSAYYGLSGGYLPLQAKYRKKIIEKAVRRLRKQHIVKFDAIIISGASGLLIGPEVARRLNVGLAIIRKKTERAHGNPIEFSNYAQHFLVLDDIVSEGKTFRFIKKRKCCA